MTVEHWSGTSENADTAWNHCLLGEVDLPGIVTVSVSRATKIDIQNPKGSDGAYIVDEGNDPASVSIDVRLLNEVHLRAWEEAVPKLTAKTPGKARSALEIKHPECTIMGVKSVYVREISGDPPTAKGGKRYSIDCIEFIAQPKKPKAAAKKSATPVKAYPPPSPSKVPLTHQTREQQAFQPTGLAALDQVFG